MAIRVLKYNLKLEYIMNLQSIERRSGLNKETFTREYLNPSKPVILTDLMTPWSATKKWTLEYFKEKHGDVLVPVFNTETYSKPGKGYMEPERKMPFGEFLSTIEQGPTNLRMFLFNIFQHIPELINDFKTPTIMDGFVEGFPFLFFGGEGSEVRLHYDVDYSCVFLNQFHGRKRVVLFPPEQSKNIYQHPFTVKSHIDVNNPDYNRFPALKKVQGYECIVNPGETLFMPSCYWHYIEYLDSGFSLSLRANDSLVTRAYGLMNIAKHYVIDKSMNKLMGEQWLRIKEDIAYNRAKAS